MSTTGFAVNHPLAQKLYANQLMREALKATYFERFIGSTSSSLVQIKTETSKSAGDQITVGLRMQMTGDGVQGDATLEGSEEAQTFYNDALVINQQRHAVRSTGKMSEQRVPWSMREEAKAGLTDWWAGRLDTCFFNQLAGYTVASASNTLLTGNNAALAPDAAHKVYLNGSADESATSAYVMDLTTIDKCVEKAKTASPVLRPLKVRGKDKYVMFLHPYQVYNLRTSTSSGQWLDITKAALSGGRDEGMAIYDGALGEYNGVVLHESTRVPEGVNSSTAATITTVRRALFCGAQAGMIAFGQGGDASMKATWVEQKFDYDNQLGVSAGMIFGIKKSRFNSADFGTIVVPTYAVAHG